MMGIKQVHTGKVLKIVLDTEEFNTIQLLALIIIKRKPGALVMKRMQSEKKG